MSFDLFCLPRYPTQTTTLPDWIEECVCLEGYRSSEPLVEEVFIDPLLQEVVKFPEFGLAFDWIVDVFPLFGVTDAVGATAADCLKRHTGTEGNVSSGKRYLIRSDASKETIREWISTHFANPLIHSIQIHAPQKPIQTIALPSEPEKLLAMSRELQLALNLEEMQAIRAHFQALGRDPTDGELEVLAQTWSEHCKHKIFGATIHTEGQTISSLYKTYIQGVTKKIDAPWLLSVFTDNAGVITFDEKLALTCKVETHNSPSALDPYGGALTGILGVNRDILGTGKGCRVMANTDVFCFAPPTTERAKWMMEGVRLGVEHGGNKSGIPTVNGALCFDARYRAKPLVYCGSVGIMPQEICGEKGHEKPIHPGDRVVVAGGRVGKDGIHGATFSSEELHEDSPQSAVQIGDPYTQKKLTDFLLEARDFGLYRTLTDNGAGGLSSSVGEMAERAGGVSIDLASVPLKYPGLKPWEILVSESQERMTLICPPESIERLELLALKHEVELTDIGAFEKNGKFHVTYGKQILCDLDLEFLHDGVPTLELEAQWAPPSPPTESKRELTPQQALLELLSRPNTYSKEAIVRQYDHEVQGQTIGKPLAADAAVLLPLECIGKSHKGVVVSNGICPKFSDYDTYAMAANAIDEAVRNAVAVGADPNHLALLDNFCWPDPIYDPEKTPDGKHKLAQLVRACQALYDTCLAFGTPLISGKDSMKNDAMENGVKVSVPPTLLITAVGTIPDVRRWCSTPFKQAGDLIYLCGETKEELKGSEYAELTACAYEGSLPTVDAQQAKALYDAIHEAINQGIITASHDCSEGGVAVALAEMAMLGELGANCSWNMECSDEAKWFGESPSRLLLTVKPGHKERFEALMEGRPHQLVGTVTSDPLLQIDRQISHSLGALRQAWTEPKWEGHNE